MSAKSRTDRSRAKGSPKALDKGLEKPRGRPRQADSDEALLSRADAYFDVFRAALPSLWADLAAAASADEVTKGVREAFERADVRYIHEFEPLTTQLLEAVLSPKFPKGHDSRARFVADSLAARGRVRVRRSRDLVGEVRQQIGRPGRILRVEMYVECSCGYQGPSHDRACPNCAAKIPKHVRS
jgi:hypothetical protein